MRIWSCFLQNISHFLKNLQLHKKTQIFPLTLQCTAVPVVAANVGVPLLREAAPGSLSSRPGSTPGYWTAVAAAYPPPAREGWGLGSGLDTGHDGQLTCNKENQVTKADIEKLCEFLSMLFKRWIKHSPCQLHRYPANSFAFCIGPITIYLW